MAIPSTERTNVTDSGYTFNNQNFKNETRTDSQGNSYSVAIPTSSLATPQTPIVPVQPAVADVSTLASNANSYINNSALDATKSEEALQKQNEITLLNEKQGAVGALANMQSSMGGRGSDQLAANTQLDANGNSVNSLAGKLRSINAQSQALGIDTLAKQQAEINKATGQNITSAAVQRNTSDVTRDNLINTARLAMESAIVKADYDTAKSYADQIVEAKYAQKTADIEAAKTNIDNIKENLTTAQKKAADATLQRLKKEEEANNEKKASEKAVNDLLINASSQGVPSNIEAKAKAVQARGGSAQEVASALGVYAGDYLATQIKKAQLQKLNLDNKEAYNKLYDSPIGALKQLSYEENAKFNSAPETKAVKDSAAYAKAIADYKSAIQTYGTGELFGAGSGFLVRLTLLLLGLQKITILLEHSIVEYRNLLLLVFLSQDYSVVNQLELEHLMKQSVPLIQILKLMQTGY